MRERLMIKLLCVQVLLLIIGIILIWADSKNIIATNIVSIIVPAIGILMAIVFFRVFYVAVRWND